MCCVSVCECVVLSHGGLLDSLKSRELPFTRMALNIS